MDPATIVGLVSSAGALATLCGSAAKDLNTLVSKYKNAKLAILSMVQGLDTMQLAWSRIGKWAQNQGPDELLKEDDFIGRLRRSLETGSLVMDALNEELLSYKPLKMGLTQRTKVVWNEGALRTHQERIRDQASSMALLLQAIHLPTLGDRNNLFRESEEQFGKSDESAYSIVPSRMSMSIHTGQTVDSGASKSEVDLVYKPLTFENELFTARVYKRNYRTPALQRFFKGTAQKTSDSTRPRTVAQKVEQDSDGSEDENCTIREPGPTAGIEDSSGGLYLPPYAEPHLSFDEACILFARACEQGDVETIESFLASGRDVHASVPEVNQSCRSFPDLSAIHFAAKRGHVQVVEILLSYGANKEMKSLASRRRPLHLAVEAGHVAMVRYLLDKGTDIAASDPGSGQAIHLAAGCGSTEMLSLLLDRGAAIDSAMINGDQPLHVASQHPDRANVIRLLCSQGADIEAKMDRGFTPLYYSSSHNHVDNMKTLLELGATHSPQGLSILGIAVQHGYLQATRLLLERGVDPNCPVYGERTALRRLVKAYTMVSSERYHLYEYADVVELLLENGAEVDLQDSNGNTPLHCLCSRRENPMSKEEKLQLQLSTKLMRSTRDVDMINFAGDTALGLSIKSRCGVSLIQLVFASGGRLLMTKPETKHRFEIDGSSDAYRPFLACHLRQGDNSFTMRVGTYDRVDQDSPPLLNRNLISSLRRLLQDPESLYLRCGNWANDNGAHRYATQ